MIPYYVHNNPAAETFTRSADVAGGRQSGHSWRMVCYPRVGAA